MKNRKMKKGITLIEIILAIVLIAIILGITIPRLMSNSDRAEVKATISADIKNIVESSMLWKKSSATARGNFGDVSAGNLISRLPNNMQAVQTEVHISSAGLETGQTTTGGVEETGAMYVIANALDTNGSARTGRLSLVVDLTRGAADLNWDDRLQTYAREVVTDTIAELTSGTTTAENYSTSTTLSFSSPVSAAGTYDCSVDNILCFNNVEFQ